MSGTAIINCTRGLRLLALVKADAHFAAPGRVAVAPKESTQLYWDRRRPIWSIHSLQPRSRRIYWQVIRRRHTVAENDISWKYLVIMLIYRTHNLGFKLQEG
jgi:hypothetical protein